MKKDERIERYGEAAYEKLLELRRAWSKVNPEKVKEQHYNHSRKGGSHYEKRLKYQSAGLRGERTLIRNKHGNTWRPYKRIIAQDSQLHHQWRPRTSEYDGVALVETDQHQHGYIDVIEILEGNITILTEAEIRGQ